VKARLITYARGGYGLECACDRSKSLINQPCDLGSDEAQLGQGRVSLVAWMKAPSVSIAVDVNDLSDVNRGESRTIVAALSKRLTLGWGL